jgi:beta-lactam-binding protein with PASTA domain
MPDMVGKDLDDVEDALEALGATDIKTTDLSGEGRSVWVSSNWKVCTQDPREGTREVKPSERIRLGVVKGSERCP